jgi:hypothetical protein
MISSHVPTEGSTRFGGKIFVMRPSREEMLFVSVFDARGSAKHLDII